MIQLTKLNNHPFFMNSDLIKFIESAPDTVITLLSGEKIVVREEPAAVMDRVVDFRRRVLQGTVFLNVPALQPAKSAEIAGAEAPPEH